jgi:calcineurin-like phosphoesterase family protein
MKIVYLADTHFGGSDISGYRQQPRYLSQTRELIQKLAEWIAERGDIDYVIHGGDLIDCTNDESIELASYLLQKLPCPTLLTLGNHDLTDQRAADFWLELAPELFRKNLSDCSFTHNDIGIDLLCAHWGKTPFYWDAEEPQIPYWLPEQTANAGQGKSAYRIIATHAPVFGLPQAQTGFADELHPPVGDFSTQATELAEKLSARLVLGAHNHMNLHVVRSGVHYVTVSAFTEVPFDFKYFELDTNGIKMETISLAGKLSFQYDYDFSKTYIQGRPCDRAFVDEF